MASSPLGGLSSLVAHFAAAPVEGGLGVLPLEVRPGYVRAQVPVPALCLQADGQISTIILAVAADIGLGVSVHSSVPGSAGGPTVELRMEFAGSVGPSTRAVHIEAWALDVGPVSGCGRVEIRDGSGSLVAHAVGVMSIDPPAHNRPVLVHPEKVRPFDPASLVVEVDADDCSVATARLCDGMANGLGTVHGGVLTAMADLAQEAFRDRHGAARPLSLTVEFLRPVHPATAVVELHSAFARRGRRFWTVRTEMRRPDGVPVLRATATSLVEMG